ncbi:MAG: hypothetical protein DDT33_01643 [Firmicutes bacterium]|nr:hypothetical protein [Bacillota bacterium]
MNNLHFDIDAEAVVLMELMLYPSRENMVLLSDTDFHRDLHRWIFQALKEMVAEGKDIKVKEIMGAVKERTGHDFGLSIVRMLRHAEIWAEIEFAKRVAEKGIADAVKGSAVALGDYIALLKRATKCRMLEALTAGIIARIKQGSDTDQQVHELQRLLCKGKVRGISLNVK